jgi:hypothetical protein
VKRGFGWKKSDKYSHAKWISDTLFLLRNCDGSEIRGRDVVEVVETSLAALRIALIERGQVCVKGLGTIVVILENGKTEFRFIPSPDMAKSVMASLLSSPPASSSQP